MTKMAIGRTIGLQGTALCICLISVSQLCVAQTQSAAMTQPDAPAIAPAASPAGADLVRPAWAHSYGCKSRHKQVTASEAKRNCMRATDCGEEA